MCGVLGSAPVWVDQHLNRLSHAMCARVGLSLTDLTTLLSLTLNFDGKCGIATNPSSLIIILRKREAMW